MSFPTAYWWSGNPADIELRAKTTIKSSRNRVPDHKPVAFRVEAVYKQFSECLFQ
jgi:hypothetical protein